MDLYHFNYEGLYLQTTEAKLRPESSPDAGLPVVPRNATTTRPPQAVLDGEVAGYWIGNSWSSVPISIENETPTEAELRTAILDQIDKTTEQLIVFGFVDENDQKVRLLPTDQLNFEGHKDELAAKETEGLTLVWPIEIKVWTHDDGTPLMKSIASVDEYKAFVRSGKDWIWEKLNEGWALKREVPNMTFEQLQTWVDPRL